MTKIDISKVREGDMVQVMHGNWTRVADIDAQTREDGQGWFRVDESLAPIHTDYLTGHKPAASPEPQAEWVTEEEWMPGGKEEYALHHRFSLKYINRLLTRKYGPPPVVKIATGEEEGWEQVLYQGNLTGNWWTVCRCDLNPGDRYVELPKCCGEGV